MNTLSNLPPGVTDYDIEEAAGAFDEPESNEVDARELKCGCVEFSNGELSFCFEHAPDEELVSVPCSKCGKPTTWDSTCTKICATAA